MGGAAICAGPIDVDVLQANDPQTRRQILVVGDKTCAGCHDNPDSSAVLPALNLFDQARSMTGIEFAARLYTGIRGDALTALANPLGASDMAALIAYYRQEPSN